MMNEKQDVFHRSTRLQFIIHHSAFIISTIEWLAAAVAEARGGVLLLRAAGGALEADAQVRAAAGAEVGVGRDDRAARPAAARQRRHVASGLARDVALDDLPGVLRQLVLPVEAERGQGQERREDDEGDRRDRGLVEPLLHAYLDARPAVLGRDLDCERGGESRQVAQRAGLSRLKHGGRRYLHRLDFEGVVAVEERPQLLLKIRRVRLDARIESALHDFLKSPFAFRSDFLRALFYAKTKPPVRMKQGKRRAATLR